MTTLTNAERARVAVAYPSGESAFTAYSALALEIGPNFIPDRMEWVRDRLRQVRHVTAWYDAVNPTIPRLLLMFKHYPARVLYEVQKALRQRSDDDLVDFSFITYTPQSSGGQEEE